MFITFDQSLVFLGWPFRDEFVTIYSEKWPLKLCIIYCRLPQETSTASLSGRSLSMIKNYITHQKIAKTIVY